GGDAGPAAWARILRIGARQILLECGLVQGGRQRGARNREPFPFEIGQIDAVVLSHAHIDHSGRLPLLIHRGYTGPIYVQQTTARFCEIMLEDSARLAEGDAERENRKRERKDLPAVKPLYTVAEVAQTLRQFVTLPYLERREILPGVSIRYVDAGHILGSASVEVWMKHEGVERKVIFSGDLGQYGTPILKDPARNTEADLVLMESTYGNRLHRDRGATIREMGTIIQDADHRRGNILIPAFAVGRTQEILYLFATHYAEWNLARWSIFLDSPMAIRASQIYWDTTELYDAGGMPRLQNLVLCESAEDSQHINKIRSGAIVIAGSGMCEGGRIVHHLKHNIWRQECDVIFVGYQAFGTLGRQLVDGNRYVRILQENIHVRARIHTIGGLSAHGDQDDLARWYSSFAPPPPVYLVHGESDAAEGLAARLLKDGAPRAVVADRGMRVDLRTLSVGAP
ncbi:MAG: MBL fold metallo-hydrolase, partial [Gammaproteobacteria bacterium]